MPFLLLTTTLPKEITSLVDATYIGATKCGAMFGEALIINNDYLKEDFRYNIKCAGMLFAKTRFMGIQFTELFKDDCLKLAKKANDQADRIRKSLVEKATTTSASTSNLIFVIYQ